MLTPEHGPFISLPYPVTRILHALQASDFEAYAVGGCVRDSLLGRLPNDWDITTSALPEDVKKIFRRTVDTGIAHGTVTVLLDGNALEVTTYRIDGAYSDGRHPDRVTFTPSLSEDLKRRDFTINAMAYSEKTGLVDLFGGLEDLRQKTIRCVGNPGERFSEDALRILRAVRFSAQLGFSISDETISAIRTHAPRLGAVSAERICTELMKIAGSPHPSDFRKAWEYGITAVMLPEFDRCMETPQNNPHHIYNVGEHILSSMEAVLLPAPDYWPEETASKLHALSGKYSGRYDCRTFLTLTMLLHDISKPACRTTDAEGIDHFYGHGRKGSETAVQILRRLKLDNDTIADVSSLILYHDWRVEPSAGAVRRAVSKIGKDLFPLLLEVQLADTMAQSSRWRREKMKRILDVFFLYENILEQHQCVQLRDLAINGKDLLKLGVPKGPLIGEMLHLALAAVIDDPSANELPQLIRLVQQALADKKV